MLAVTCALFPCLLRLSIVSYPIGLKPTDLIQSVSHVFPMISIVQDCICQET